MLETLFGNRNIARILLFLFVNERCYGSQLHSLLGVPLTPIQNALGQLEKKGIITSFFEGKIRMYQFNAACALRWELEMLLKKVYILLSPQEKKRYCFVHASKAIAHKEGRRERDQRKELRRFWEKLLKVRTLSLVAKSRRNQECITQTGRAEVTSHLIDPSVLVLREKGYWFLNDHPSVGFSNSFRWTLDLKSSLITLEHLRHGAKHPVFLFHLMPRSPSRLESVDAHLCGQDTYLGSVLWDPEQITFHWRTIGPQKNDELTYVYSQ